MRESFIEPVVHLFLQKFDNNDLINSKSWMEEKRNKALDNTDKYIYFTFIANICSVQVLQSIYINQCKKKIVYIVFIQNNTFTDCVVHLFFQKFDKR